MPHPPLPVREVDGAATVDGDGPRPDDRTRSTVATTPTTTTSATAPPITHHSAGPRRGGGTGGGEYGE
ncbi:hypothetical protein AXK61_12125 [Tsukamurella pseudospumae]|uniref:Uncharacterized protein n=1 Tax=Tsukamurella pseudospumae TaxID=239498 RepID=A0A137YTU6_9ACTN|nr:hypothetical protein AXK61_12125 [Tsukamurella pseudospumae]